MAISNWMAQKVGKVLPRVISPGAHARIDWVLAGVTLGAAAYLWNRNRKAAVGLAITAVTDLTSVVMTDYPGGLFKELDFETHGHVAMRQSMMTASLPAVLRIQGTPAAALFGVHSALTALVVSMTDFKAATEPRRRVIPVGERAIPARDAEELLPARNGISVRR